MSHVLGDGGDAGPASLDEATRAALDALPHGVIVLGSDGGGAEGGRVAFANRRACELAGRELAGRTLAELAGLAGLAGGDGGLDARFLDTVIENLPAMVFIKRAEDLRFVRFNRAGAELLGLDAAAVIGRGDLELFPEEQARFFIEKDRKVLAQGHVEDIPAEPIQTPAGERWLHTRKIPIREGGVPRYLLGISVDVTEVRRAEAALRTARDDLERRVAERTAELEREIDERRHAEAELRRLQEQLLLAQKLEAVGRLAGGVAHDFNNLLTVVLSYVHLLLPAFPQGDPRRHYLDEVKRAGERGAALTRQLLAFSRQQVMARKVIDPAQILREMDTLIRKLAGKRVEVDVAIADDVGNIKADASSIEQVIMNLVVNARDAMPEGGRLSIELRNVDLDAVGAHEQLGDLRGSHVMLAVGDTGIGMDRETQQRIFEPFFTTKPRGKGTGLGLPTVFGIVTQAGGAISVESEPGRGSLFRVYLPLTREALEPAVPRSPVRSLRGTETILVADDDEQLRQVVRQTLEAQGYTVLVAADGPEAIALCERSAGPIHLLLTDLVMPHMSGRELAGRLASIRPAMKVLYMSGYAEVVTASHDLGATHAALLQKPITPESLLRKLREVLGGT